jgi:DUF2934 family protein
MKSKTVRADVENSEQEAVEFEQTQPQFASAPSREEIRQRAYELHVERGYIHGKDQDDWLHAERDLIEKYQSR